MRSKARKNLPNTAESDYYCLKCGYRLEPREDKFCPNCGKAVVRKEVEFLLSDADTKDIPIIGKSPFEVVKEKNGTIKPKDYWLSGSYYLVAGSLVLTLLLVITKIVDTLFLPLVIIITLFGISLFGAFQLQLDEKNKTVAFHKLMLLTLKNFLLGESKKGKPSQSNKLFPK